MLHASLLKNIEKPGRYVGGELNQIVKPDAAARLALCFPDAYEIGMSHTGLRVLYHAVNQVPQFAAERCFAPWPDFEQRLRETNTRLWSLETHRALADFDAVGFSLQYELSYPTLLNMLDLGGIAVRRDDRGDDAPLVIAGGAGAFNPEPMADFIDGFLIGEGEDAVVEICALLERRKRENWPRLKLLTELTRVRGMYVPKFFDFDFRPGSEGGTIRGIRRTLPEYTRAEHRQVVDLDAAPFPNRPLVPNVGIVHDRVGVEVQRGCTKGCRFCQAGMIFRPTRQRSPKTVLKLVDDALTSTGQDEVSFLSLSIGDYEPLQPLLKTFFDRYDAAQVGVSLPSLRTETLTQDVVNEIARGRKHSFTLAPEAGSDRMRRIINKGNTEANLMKAVETATAAGWKSLKYYFMIGLPFESEPDREAIAHLGIQSRRYAAQLGRQLDVAVSVSSFVPKPHTPFQWHAQVPEPDIRQYQHQLRALLKRGKCDFRYHNSGQTQVEGVLSRGDRRLGAVIETAWRLGCRLDAWDEHFSLERWMQAFEELKVHGIDWQWYHRERGLDEILPWDAVDSGVDKKFLSKELGRARLEAEVEDCAWGKCHACSACDFKTIEPLVYPKVSLPVIDGPSAWVQATIDTTVARDGGAADAIERAKRPANQPLVTVVRLKFSKQGVALYLSHLELMSGLLRSIRRARLDVAFTQGFRPRPKIAFSPALSFGVASDCEYVDVELQGTHDASAVLAALRDVAPTGLTYLTAEALPRGAPAIAAHICAMTFEAEHATAAQAWQRWSAAQAALSAGESGLVVERVREGAGRRFSLETELEGVTLESPTRLRLTIVQRLDGTLRLDDVARVLFAEAADDVQWRKLDVRLGAQQTSPAQVFRVASGAAPSPSRQRHSSPRDDAAVVGTPFSE